jgi:hypothetical protein
MGRGLMLDLVFSLLPTRRSTTKANIRTTQEGSRRALSLQVAK